MATETIDYNDLFAGGLPIAHDKITLLSGQNLTAGAVLGRITTGGKYKLSAVGAGDGSETPVAVLAIDCDASAGDKQTSAYFSGEFNGAKLTLGASHTIATVTAAFRASASQLFIRTL